MCGSCGVLPDPPFEMLWIPTGVSIKGRGMKEAEKRDCLQYFCCLIPVSTSLILKSMIFFFFFFLDAPLDLQDLKFRNQESNPLTLQWKHIILTTGPPGKSPNEQKFYVHFRSVCFSVTTEWIGHLAEVCNTKQASWLYLFWSTVKLSILSKGKQPH